MKTLVKITLLTLLLYSCSMTDQSGKRTKSHDHADAPYFEGEIHFSIDYDSFPSHLTLDYLQEVLGSKMILVFKNGNLRKDYYSPQGKLISQRLLDLSVSKSFSIRPDEDTVLWFDVSKPDSKTDFVKLNDTIIKGYNCVQLRTKTHTPNPQNKAQNLIVNSHYYAASELRVNPKWYANYVEGSYNETIKVTRSLAIEIYEKGPYWNTTTIADTIIWRRVKNNELKIENMNKKTFMEL